jgi:hypothetical protein
MRRGLFPETLPPCFTSKDCSRAFRGIIGDLDDRRFNKRRYAEYVPYNGTKHDGNRRAYATPHPVAYYYICSFIRANWKTFERAFISSPFSVSALKLLDDDGERSIQVTPLSEVSSHVRRKVKHAPHILRADISQFYGSIYTHVISWAAHGKERSKADHAPGSAKNRFNRLDFFVRNAQDGQTRGLLIGPDAYRIIAEFIAAKFDLVLRSLAGSTIIGAARHVDDFYIGVRSETDAAIVLSHLREAIGQYELHLNDLKTAIIPGTHPFDDLWAIRLRRISNELAFDHSEAKLIEFFDDAVSTARQLGTQSPVKLALRRADQHRLYDGQAYETLEHYFQRLAYHFPHAVDYICLLVAKRHAIGRPIDRAGWSEVANAGIARFLQLGSHHEACWLLWLSIFCSLDLDNSVIESAPTQRNSHFNAMLIKSFVDGKLARRPRITFPARIESGHRDWLVSLVGRSIGFTRASFSGCYAGECEHLASKQLQLIDFTEHRTKVATAGHRAIANVRFGYEDEDEDEQQDEEETVPEMTFDENPF